MIALLITPVIASGNCGAKGIPRFEQFTAGELFRGKVHTPLLTTHLARKFRTSVRWAVEEGVNFGGHYVVATWGCGTGCAQFAIIDAITGTVYDPPFSAVYFHYSFALNKTWPDFDAEGKWWCEDFVTFKLTSRLLVAEGCIADSQCGRTYFTMTPTKLKQVYFDPDLSPDGTVAPP